MALVIAWLLFQHALPLILHSEPLRDARPWAPTATALVFLTLLLVLLWGLYVAVRPAVDGLGSKLSNRIGDLSDDKCPTCHASVPPGNAFCAACGTRRAPEVASKVSPKCLSCGADATSDNRFCAECGSALASLIAPGPSATQNTTG